MFMMWLSMAEGASTTAAYTSLSSSTPPHLPNIINIIPLSLQRGLRGFSFIHYCIDTLLLHHSYRTAAPHTFWRDDRRTFKETTETVLERRYSSTFSMKRNCSEEECDFEIYEDPIDSPLNNHANHLISPHGDNSSPRSRGGLTPTGPTGLKSNSPRPSKIRRHGSKLLSALRSIRSLTNSGKNPKSLSPLTSSPVSGETSIPSPTIPTITTSIMG